MTASSLHRVLDLRTIFGVEATITTSAESTNGAYVEMDCLLQPGSGSLTHRHPGQEETYRVVEGTLDVMLDGEWRRVPAGESLTIPPDTVHAFRNSSHAPVRFVNVHRPALGFQAHLETVDRLVRAGKVRGTKDLRFLIYLSMSAAKHRPDVPVKPPFWVLRAMAGIGERLGFRLDE